MTWYYEGQEIEENKIYDIVAENYGLDDFEDDLNEMYSPVEICGSTFEQGTALRKVDEVAFKCSYDTECNYMAREIIYRKDETDCYDFGIRWTEDEVA